MNEKLKQDLIEKVPRLVSAIEVVEGETTETLLDSLPETMLEMWKGNKQALLAAQLTFAELRHRGIALPLSILTPRTPIPRDPALWKDGSSSEEAQ